MFEIKGIKVKLSGGKWWQWLVFIVRVISLKKGDFESVARLIESVESIVVW